MTDENKKERFLTPDMIPDPSLHRLAMLVSPESLDVVVTSRVNENDVVHKRLPFTADKAGLSALEERVYDNPLLISDFHKVNVMLDNNRFFVMPSKEATPDEVSRRIEALWPSGQQAIELQPIVTDIENGRTVFVTAIERPLAAFFRRTWNRPSIEHRLAVLARYHGLQNHLGNMGKIHAHVTPRRLDLVIYGREGLLMANSFNIGGVDDAVFYTLSAVRHFGFDNETDRVLVDGPADMREAYMTSLRRFVDTVMPEIKPSALAAVGDDVPPETLLPQLM